jgi:competence protein ComEA
MRARRIVALIVPLMLFAGGLMAAPVNVNNASAQEIAAALQGIGPAKAKAIVDYRTAHGPFKTVQDLTHVKGIGSKMVQKLAKDIKLE